MIPRLGYDSTTGEYYDREKPLARGRGGRSGDGIRFFDECEPLNLCAELEEAAGLAGNDAADALLALSHLQDSLDRNRRRGRWSIVCSTLAALVAIASASIAAYGVRGGG